LIDDMTMLPPFLNKAAGSQGGSAAQLLSLIASALLAFEAIICGVSMHQSDDTLPAAAMRTSASVSSSSLV
jgi:hypothetical protein